MSANKNNSSQHMSAPTVKSNPELVQSAKYQAILRKEILESWIFLQFLNLGFDPSGAFNGYKKLKNGLGT
jgi:hypothetical protein